MWMYVGAPYDYDTQRELSGDRLGGFRIVTDCFKNILGMAYHPNLQGYGFRRATERRRVSLIIGTPGHTWTMVFPRFRPLRHL
jgi:hypothetical protein